MSDTRRELIDNLYFRLSNNDLITTSQNSRYYTIMIKDNGNIISFDLDDDEGIMIYLQALCNAYNV